MFFLLLGRLKITVFWKRDNIQNLGVTEANDAEDRIYKVYKVYVYTEMVCASRHATMNFRIKGKILCIKEGGKHTNIN
jgi:hypothetical protein